MVFFRMRDRTLSSPSRQHGIALLTVLMVFALAAFLATDMAMTGVSDTQHAAVRRDVRQAYYYALGGEAYARELLWQDRDTDVRAAREADGRHDLWRDGVGGFALDEGEIRIQVTDLQGRFNLANLRGAAGGRADPVALAQLRGVLEALDLDVALSQRIADWVDGDSEALPSGAEDQHYATATVPQLTANVPPGVVAELVRIMSLTEEQYALLKANLTSLPEATKLNLNTSQPAVLLAFAGPGRLSAVRALLNKQAVTTYADLDDALSDNGFATSEELRASLTTTSQWFEIDVVAEYRQRAARLRSMVHRDARSGVTRVIYRSPVGRVKAQ
jgi:general secretion pathway protein K